uniref:TSA: Wollemia nobilis Ref_Wollemi_Transcript_13395_916 transcribed RNA sequence n=1 Tax=Wollemia nobilis TaxID=56998 RepID=A0A0C9RTV2_9CONI
MKGFTRAGAECFRVSQLPAMTPLPHHSSRKRRSARGNNIRCNLHGSEKPRQGLKRRQVLLASTTVHAPAAGLMFQPRDQVSSLTDYHKLKEAEKLKFKYASNVDVASLFSSSDPGKGVPNELSGMVSVPCQHYCIGNNDFVEARVDRPAFSEEWRGREEELVMQGIKVKKYMPLGFDVYIRPADREEDDEYAGSFIHVPPRSKLQRRRVGRCCLRLGISDIMEDLDAYQHTTFIVTLVPKFKTDPDPVSVENIRIEYS